MVIIRLHDTVGIHSCSWNSGPCLRYHLPQPPQEKHGQQSHRQWPKLLTFRLNSSPESRDSKVHQKVVRPPPCSLLLLLCFFTSHSSCFSHPFPFSLSSFFSLLSPLPNLSFYLPLSPCISIIKLLNHSLCSIKICCTTFTGFGNLFPHPSLLQPRCPWSGDTPFPPLAEWGQTLRGTLKPNGKHLGALPAPACPEPSNSHQTFGPFPLTFFSRANIRTSQLFCFQQITMS